MNPHLIQIEKLNAECVAWKERMLQAFKFCIIVALTAGFVIGILTMRLIQIWNQP